MDKINKVTIRLGAIGIIVFSIFFLPWLDFWLAYFGGWIAKIIIGTYLVEGLNYLHINVPLNKIPLLAGCLGWIGGFFQGIKFNTNNNNN